MKQMSNKLKLILIITFSLLIFAGAFGLITSFVKYAVIKGEYDSLAKLVNTENGNDKAKVDFNSIKNVNKDIIGWIMIPNTDINYPITKTKDNEYYLTHTSRRTVSDSGSIFMDHNNKKNLTDYNTILYGHNMKDGSMFSDLNNFLNPSFLKKNKTIYVYIGSRIYTYNIIEARVAQKNDIVFSMFSPDYTADDFNDYLARVAPNHTKKGAKNKNRYITLSTCDTASSTTNKRVVVTGVLK